jgi:hypothetical protein
VRRATLALGLVLLLAATTPAEDAPRTVRAGKHFRVVAHFKADAVAEQLLTTVEALWPHAARLYGLGDGALETPLEVHLYPDTASYGKAMDKLAGGKFKRNLAAALWAPRSAHVALQPEVSDDLLRAEGLPYLTRNLLLHEASHLVRFHAMANYRSHPDWLADGAAQWLKYETLRSLGLITTLVDDPTSARAIERVQKKGPVAVETILDDGVRDDNWYTVYAVKRLFFTYLMHAHADATMTALQAIKRLGGGHDFGARAKAAFLESLDDDARAELEAGFKRYLNGLKPAWTEVFRSLETVGDDWLQVAFPGTNAVAWRRQAVGRTKYTFEARVRLRRNFGKQANILLDKRDGGFISIAITAGFGVTVFAYDAKQNNWERRASTSIDGLDVEQDHAVRVEIDGARLEVRFDDNVVADVAFPERQGGLTGPWGLGAQAGTAVRWSGVKVK